jgi:MbtH protein
VAAVRSGRRQTKQNKKKKETKKSLKTEGVRPREPLCVLFEFYPTMADAEKVTEEVFRVVVNAEKQYSIWPSWKTTPVGWEDEGKKGTKQECLDYIETVWTDMRPLSLQKFMAQFEDPAKTANKHPIQIPPLPDHQGIDYFHCTYLRHTMCVIVGECSARDKEVTCVKVPTPLLFPIKPTHAHPHSRTHSVSLFCIKTQPRFFFFLFFPLLGVTHLVVIA